MLADRLIREAVEGFSDFGGSLHIDPWRPENVGPASIDLCLDRHFLVPKHPAETWPEMTSSVDPFEDQTARMRPVELPNGYPFVLGPGHFVLASTEEYVALSSRLAAKIEGKSSLGRLGLNIHVTAGFVDPGFEGTLTLELVNQAPWDIQLWPGMKICQMAFNPVTGRVVSPYGVGSQRLSKYRGQRGPVSSRYHLNERPQAS